VVAAGCQAGHGVVGGVRGATGLGQARAAVSEGWLSRAGHGQCAARGGQGGLTTGSCWRGVAELCSGGGRRWLSREGEGSARQRAQRRAVRDLVSMDCVGVWRESVRERCRLKYFKYFHWLILFWWLKKKTSKVMLFSTAFYAAAENSITFGG
jgi:hypothetical protein